VTPHASARAQGHRSSSSQQRPGLGSALADPNSRAALLMPTRLFSPQRMLPQGQEGFSALTFSSEVAFFFSPFKQNTLVLP